MHHGDSFDPKNLQSLPDPDFETRNSLSNLAIAIVAAKYDLSAISADDAIKALRETIENLHAAYR